MGLDEKLLGSVHMRLHNLVPLLLSVFGLFELRPVEARQCQPEWSEEFSYYAPIGVPGVQGEVHAAAVFDDGTGPALYVGGSFTVAGSVVANFVARWDGVRWRPLKGGLNSTVCALFVFDEDGPGPNSSALFAGGNFTLADGIVATKIARWDGSSWSPVGGGISDASSGGIVYCMGAFDEDGDGPGIPRLFVGGSFSSAGGASIGGSLARWDGNQWSGVQGGVGGSVHAITVFDEDAVGPTAPHLVVGGGFVIAGGINIGGSVARWDGDNWSALGSGIPGGGVNALAIHDEDGAGVAPPQLFAGGAFSLPGGAHVARWNGSSWAGLGGGVSSNVRALVSHDEDGDGPGAASLFVGGDFAAAGGQNFVYGIARWGGSNWSSVGGGVGGRVLCFAQLDRDGVGPLASRLIVGGDFTTIDATGGNLIPANRLAEWEGAQWVTDSEGDGLNGGVRAFAWNSADPTDGLWAAGVFTDSGNSSAVLEGVARWDGTAWTSVGAGLPGQPSALALSDDGSGRRLFAATASSTGRVAKLVSNAWQSLGGNFNGPVHAIAAYSAPNGLPEEIYAAGNFTTAGGAPAQRIARWTGGGWAPLGGGLSDAAFALAVWDDDGPGPNSSSLYVGGQFETAGNVYSPLVARWDGASWSPAGTANAAEPNITRDPLSQSAPDGLSFVDSVRALAVYDDGSGPALHAAGTFVRIGGTVARRIAKYDGIQWSPLGAGLSDPAYALAVYQDGFGEALYAGGEFNVAGNVIARGLARWQGGQWSEAHGGVRGTVSALLPFDPGPGAPSLFVGGEFTAADQTPSVNIAELKGCPVPPGNFPLAFPPQGATCVGTTPTLEWAAEPNADTYRVRIARNWMLTNPVVDVAGISSTSYTVPAGMLLPAVRYYWGIVATNTSGSAASLPKQRTFVTTLLGDADLNGLINFLDLNIVLGAFGSMSGQPNYFANADFNGDNLIDFIDLNIVLSAFGLGC